MSVPASAGPGNGPPEERLEIEASRSLWKENRQILLLAGIVVTFMTVAHFTPLKSWITNVQIWKHYIDDLGWIGHLVFALVCAVAIMLGAPRLPLCGVAGMLFGFFEGWMVSWLASTLGSYGAFLMARLGTRQLAEGRLSRWPWLMRLLEAPSFLTVVWVRQLMVPGLVLNLIFGVTKVEHRTFLFGTLVGYLPLNVAFTLVGSGLGKESLSQSVTQIVVALGLVNLVGWAVWRVVERHRAERRTQGGPVG
ncbi:MAG: VTT domain-containing protein [Verrucomicrobiales bacterium]